MGVVLQVINVAFTLYSFAIIARALLPWFNVNPYHPAMQFLFQITEPLLAPIRQNIPPLGGLDFSPMVALLILWFVEQLLRMLLLSLVG